MDINRYKNKCFHIDESIHNKIAALFLLYDKQCEDARLGYINRIKLINYFIKTLIDNEEYEVAQAFRNRKFIKYRKYRRDRMDYLPVFGRLFRIKINKLIRKISNFVK